MTIICIRDGIMAVDSQISAGTVHCGTIQKWRAIPVDFGGGFAAACGEAGPCAAALDTVEKGAPLVEHDSVTLVWLRGDGTVLHFVKGGKMQVDAPFFADGAGCAVATGAFAMGATAEQAAQAACDFDKDCGGQVHVLRLGATQVNMKAA